MSKQEDSGRHNKRSGEQRDPWLDKANRPPPSKMSSALELSRYKVGNSAWWVTLRYQDPLPELPKEAAWMMNCHPKALYEHGPYKNYWPFRAKLPRLHHVDFSGVVTFLTSEFMVEKFDVCEVIRSQDTGEFFYANQDDEWMPEPSLFDTIIAARRERTRVVKMMRRWVNSHGVGN